MDVSYLFFNATATTGNYTEGHTLSLHDALPISSVEPVSSPAPPAGLPPNRAAADVAKVTLTRLVPGAPVPADLGLPGRRVPGPLTAAIFAVDGEELRIGIFV